MRTLLLICTAAVSILYSAPAQSQIERIHISYLPPKDPAHQDIYRRLQKYKTLENLRDLLSAIRLPRRLDLVAKGCDGVANAWYEKNVVTLCYEFMAEIEAKAPKTPTEAGITRDDAIIGTLVQVLLHETGHALFELLQVPIFGREEDAADQFAAYVILQMHAEDARRIIDGVTHMLMSESGARPLDRDAFSDVHGLPQQRFFNLICMAYGAHTWLYADIVSKGLLPVERADGCKAEYRQIAFAMDKLISPHLDPESRGKFTSTLKTFRMPDEKK